MVVIKIHNTPHNVRRTSIGEWSINRIQYQTLECNKSFKHCVICSRFIPSFAWSFLAIDTMGKQKQMCFYTNHYPLFSVSHICQLELLDVLLCRMQCDESLTCVNRNWFTFFWWFSIHTMHHPIDWQCDIWTHTHSRLDTTTLIEIMRNSNWFMIL